jgi:ABC-type Fe3+/spermidine/putrescine transport system ATPase subunit
MLEIKDISVDLGKFSLKNISLDIHQGDYMTILGMSGAGKTVLLEILSGLIRPDKGKILLNKNDITRETIQKRPFGLVYQDMALFPHMRVKDNILFALRGKQMKSEEKQKVLHDLATRTNVLHLLDRYPGTLSGGEAQRVALARTLARNPLILLLDEPLASLDVKLREELRRLLRSINQLGTTIVHVTHDYMEAATLSNKVAIIENGELIQWGVPQEVFRNPASEFVARFSGIKNIFHCSFSKDHKNPGIWHGTTTSHHVTISLLSEPSKEEGYLMIPGEDIIVSENKLETSAVNQFQGKIREVFVLSNGAELIIEAGEEFAINVSRLSADKFHLEKGKNVWISFKASAVRIL